MQGRDLRWKRLKGIAQFLLLSVNLSLEVKKPWRLISTFKKKVSAICYINAQGDWFPPRLLIQAAPKDPDIKAVKDWANGQMDPHYTPSGWMTNHDYLDWFRSAFIPHVERIRQAKQLAGQRSLLVLDGHPRFQHSVICSANEGIQTAGTTQR